MAHNSTENLIGSDSSTSTDELNNGSHSRSVEKVSKKMFHKKKTAFGANSVTSPSSSVTSSPQQHPIIVVGTADVHQPRLSPPKPLPRKHLMTTAEPRVTKRKDFLEVDDILDISTSTEIISNRSEEKENITNRENIELCELRTQSESSGGQSDKTEEPKMFFARSRKNTIVTNIDEVSIKSSSRTNKSSQNESKSEELKPLPKPRRIEPQYEIIQEKHSKKRLETPVPLSNNEASYSDQSKSSYSASETLTDEAISNYEENQAAKRKVVSEEVHDHPSSFQKDSEQDKIVGVYIHSSSELKYDYNVHRPMVRCSIVDGITGQLLQSRNTNGMIQPILTKGCRFTSSNSFQCQWEQLLIFNENISHIMHENTIIFFELLDTPSTESKNIFVKWSKITDEWHYICWGFLKIGDGINYSNIDKRSRLQLFRYQRGHFFRKYSLNVYDQFRLDRVKYPATLYVTVKGITTVNSPLENNEQMKLEWNIFIDKTQPESNKVQQFTNMDNTSIIQANFRRLPGQICKYPNMIHKTHLEASSKGCLVSKFSPNGQFLAYSSNSDYNIQIATVPDLKVINTLRGHTNFVYDLDWLVDKRKNSFPLHLVSASSDRTAVVWTIEKDKISLTILPHPSFLYAAKFLVNLTDDECCLFAVTGGRDCAVRVWKVADNNFDLLQESEEHPNYITSIACSSKNCNFFSSDWNGCIFEWSTQEHSKYFQVTRKFRQLTEGILTLNIHPKNELRLYAQLKNNQINCLDISSGLILNTLDSVYDNQGVTNKFTISPCGSTIYTTQWDTIFIHNILSGTLQSSFKVSYVKHRKSYISHLDYHPKLFLLSASVYGVNGGVVLLSHKSDAFSANHKETIHQSSFEDRWMMLKENVNPKSSELLGNIIQRIDDILHQPHQHKNETDDLKKKNIEDMNRSDRGNDYDQNIGNVGTSVEVGSLKISSESDSDSSIGSGGTFTIKRKQSESEISNRTFTLQKNVDGSKGKPQRNDGTYSIEVDNNSDDTTISESM